MRVDYLSFSSIGLQCDLFSSSVGGLLTGLGISIIVVVTTENLAIPIFLTHLHSYVFSRSSSWYTGLGL